MAEHAIREREDQNLTLIKTETLEHAHHLKLKNTYRPLQNADA